MNKVFFAALSISASFLCAMNQLSMVQPESYEGPKRYNSNNSPRKIDIDQLIQSSKVPQNPAITRVRKQSFGSKDFLQSDMFVKEENLKEENLKRNETK